MTTAEGFSARAAAWMPATKSSGSSSGCFWKYSNRDRSISWALPSSPLAAGLVYTLANIKSFSVSMAWATGGDCLISGWPALAWMASRTSVSIRARWVKPSTSLASRGMSMG
mgnify:CR=1 FL=1